MCAKHVDVVRVTGFGFSQDVPGLRLQEFGFQRQRSLDVSAFCSHLVAERVTCSLVHGNRWGRSFEAFTKCSVQVALFVVVDDNTGRTLFRGVNHLFGERAFTALNQHDRVLGGFVEVVG